MRAARQVMLVQHTLYCVCRPIVQQEYAAHLWPLVVWNFWLRFGFIVLIKINFDAIRWTVWQLRWFGCLVEVGSRETLFAAKVLRMCRAQSLFRFWSGCWTSARKLRQQKPFKTVIVHKFEILGNFARQCNYPFKRRSLSSKFEGNQKGWELQTPWIHGMKAVSALKLESV